jgi:hypothetical protein
MIDRLGTADPRSYSAFEGVRFEASLSLQASFALFGVALGLAASVLLRRTVPAMGVTLAVFAGVRGAVALLRHSYLPPLQVFVPLSSGAPASTDGGAILSWDQVDAAGQPVSVFPVNCMNGADTQATIDACLHRNGVVRDLLTYQPADRLPTFRLIETGIFVVLTVALCAVTWLWLRRSTVRGAR